MTAILILLGLAAFIALPLVAAAVWEARRLQALAADVSEHLGEPVTATRLQSGGIGLRAPNGNGHCIRACNLGNISPANCAAALAMR